MNEPLRVVVEAEPPATALAETASFEVFVTATGWEHGESVTVRATYPYTINLLGFVVSSGDLTSETTERVE